MGPVQRVEKQACADAPSRDAELRPESCVLLQLGLRLPQGEFMAGNSSLLGGTGTERDPMRLGLFHESTALAV